MKYVLYSRQYWSIFYFRNTRINFGIVTPKNGSKKLGNFVILLNHLQDDNTSYSYWYLRRGNSSPEAEELSSFGSAPKTIAWWMRDAENVRVYFDGWCEWWIRTCVKNNTRKRRSISHLLDKFRRSRQNVVLRVPFSRSSEKPISLPSGRPSSLILRNFLFVIMVGNIEILCKCTFAPPNAAHFVK